MRRLALPALLLVVALVPVGAQHASLQVFRTTSSGGNTAGQDTLTFLDVLTGETATADVYGGRYTPMGDALLYYDRLENRMMTASPDGETAPHPFIQPQPDTARLDWVVSPDARMIAWTRTATGDGDSLTTVTTVATVEGDDMREVLTDGPRNGIRAAPVAFSANNASLYMDYQPDQLGDFTPYAEYAGLFEVDIKNGGVIGFLPNEPGCFCGAGFGGGQFVRLALTDDLSGFDVEITDLAAGVTDTIPAVNLQNYTQGGDVLVSPDGAYAVYALAQVQDFGTPNQTVQTVFVLVDIAAETQRTLTNPLYNYLRPVAWTENNSAVVLTSSASGTTFKLNLDNGRLEEIARAVYIGTLPAAGG